MCFIKLAFTLSTTLPPNIIIILLIMECLPCAAHAHRTNGGICIIVLLQRKQRYNQQVEKYLFCCCRSELKLRISSAGIGLFYFPVVSENKKYTTSYANPICFRMRKQKLSKLTRVLLIFTFLENFPCQNAVNMTEGALPLHVLCICLM